FALGVVLYELWTGVRPFTGADTLALLSSVLTDDPKPPAEVRPDTPPALNALVVRLLQRDPARRPASAREGAADLGRILRLPARRPRRRWLLTTLVAASLAGVVALGTWVIIRDKDGKEVARLEVPQGGSLTVQPGPPEPPAQGKAPVIQPEAFVG